VDLQAKKLLGKLLLDAEKAGVGRRTRVPALTARHLLEYSNQRSLRAKEEFETTMRAAQAAGAVSLKWDGVGAKEEFICRVDATDAAALARFLGETPLRDQIAGVAEAFGPWMAQYPVLEEVIRRWEALWKVMALGPESTQDWLDAIRTIEYARVEPLATEGLLPVREASARLFKDSKRIEKLAAPLDVLLAGSIDAEIREPAEVWKELGLSREEQPVRMAGRVVIERSRVTSLLDEPYSAFPAPAVIRLATTPEMVLTIENQTTFHSEAARRCNEEVLLIYTAGMPSPVWRAMYRRLLKGLPAGVPVCHWGDVDEGGFRIASVLAMDAKATGHVLKPWRMSPGDVSVCHRVGASEGTLERMRRFAEAAGWAELGAAVAAAGFTVEQEAL
jgi:hypothetical protein